MPLYSYMCSECGAEEKLVAGIDNYMVICPTCGGVMLRTDEDIWAAYFNLPDPDNQRPMANTGDPT